MAVFAAAAAAAVAAVLSRPASAAVAADARRGGALYEQACQSCHQADGAGQPGMAIPSLHGVGAAAVDWWISTGRMPEANVSPQAPRKPVSIGPADRAALVAYVTTSWPGGPAIPVLDLSHGDLTAGGNLFRTNCAACHGAAGAGAALAYGAYAPSLHQADAVQVVEAVRIGPGNMPGFDESRIPDSKLGDIAAYVRYLHHPDDRGGAGLGHTGPIAEGFVGLLALLGLVGIATWVGHRADDEPKERAHGG